MKKGGIEKGDDRTTDERLADVEQMVRDLAVKMLSLSKHQGIMMSKVDALLRREFLADFELEQPLDLLANRFSLSSQTDEDGILLGIFGRIGVATRRFVDIGAGSTGGNSGMLAFELGWTGLMVDGSQLAVERLGQRAQGHDVRVVQSFVTTENVNELVREHGLDGEIDFLSIDIDGVDYWIWEALEACNPRVVSMEYNYRLGHERALTVPYAPDFSWKEIGTKGYHGASLPALVHLGRKKGYRLVACDSTGINSFFVRSDVAADLEEIPVEKAFRARYTSKPLPPLPPRLAELGLPLVELD